MQRTNILTAPIDITELQMLKLWKGMFYCMFLSDKPLVQVCWHSHADALLFATGGACAEALADDPPHKRGEGRFVHLSCYIYDFNDVVLLFWKAFYNIMAREWAGIDYLR